MITMSLRTAALGLLLAGAAPVLAQTAPPPPPHGMMAGKADGHHGKRMFSTLSEAGRQTMREAMRSGSDKRAEREQVRAARDRMLAALDADKLDMAALRKAMDDERAASNASHESRKAAMLAAFSKLSTADRKAFVAEARSMRDRMADRVGKWRERRGSGGPGTPPPSMDD